MNSFASLELLPALAKAVDVLGYETMTKVQAATLPVMLAGKDVIAQAVTGSGKTAAFGLALLSKLKPELEQIQCLVLCPTRELADQVSDDLRRLARFIPNVKVVTLCGGVPVRTQTPALAHPPHILVGTPGRILDHLRRNTIDLGSLSTLVLDEADRMLDMGFLEAIDDVVKQTPANRQTLLFSATYSQEVRGISRSLQTKPTEITVASQDDEVQVEQVFYEVEPPARFDALVKVLLSHREAAVLVFCHTRKDTRELATKLSAQGFGALALHGELEQRERDEVLLRFAHGSCTVLVATDVAARGLDIKGLPLVVSWELPIDPTIHIHRIGRTGRAGQTGRAVALCAARERDRVASIEAKQGGKVQWAALPDTVQGATPFPSPMITWLVEGGREDKLRPGDLVGALVGDLELAADAVGKIAIGKERAYVSVARASNKTLEQTLATRNSRLKVKGRQFRMSPLRTKG